jgi:hypothetical protein
VLANFVAEAFNFVLEGFGHGAILPAIVRDGDGADGAAGHGWFGIFGSCGVHCIHTIALHRPHKAIMDTWRAPKDP